MVTTLATYTGTAVLWITRDLRLAAAIADRVILLHEGRIERDGSPEELLDPFGEKVDSMVKAANRMAMPV
jgi:ABC-type glutathione transport system ATPase component